MFKNSFLFLVVIVSLFFAACEDKEKEVPPSDCGAALAGEEQQEVDMEVEEEPCELEDGVSCEETEFAAGEEVEVEEPVEEPAEEVEEEPAEEVEEEPAAGEEVPPEEETPEG